MSDTICFFGVLGVRGAQNLTSGSALRDYSRPCSGNCIGWQALSLGWPHAWQGTYLSLPIVSLQPPVGTFLVVHARGHALVLVFAHMAKVLTRILTIFVVVLVYMLAEGVALLAEAHGL